jgi:pyrroloquinoline quinone biosynthesis protein E
MGVLQVDFTGGEPLARNDLTRLIRTARGAGLYTNLITSGRPLDEKRLDELVGAGLDHFQLSFQGAREAAADEIAGTHAHVQKLLVARCVKQRPVALTLNFVIHRQNLDQLPEMIALTEEIEPGRVEFAHVQYYGWAFANRSWLLPAREQLDRSLELLKEAAERWKGRTRVEYVVPDYYAKYPKACMGGWGRKIVLITPEGDVLPCHAAKNLPGMKFENVQARSLREIWERSDALQKFRGEEWMQEPCRSCERREQDFGGCRCQAFLLAGDAAATDPACSLAPAHHLVEVAVREANGAAAVAKVTAPTSSFVQLQKQTADLWRYRTNPE